MSEAEETLKRRKNSEKGRFMKFYKGYKEGRIQLESAIKETEKLRKAIIFPENEDFLNEVLVRLNKFKNG